MQVDFIDDLVDLQGGGLYDARFRDGSARAWGVNGYGSLGTHGFRLWVGRALVAPRGAQRGPFPRPPLAEPLSPRDERPVVAGLEWIRMCPCVAPCEFAALPR